jgi:hypothetical protein
MGETLPQPEKICQLNRRRSAHPSVALSACFRYITVAVYSHSASKQLAGRWPVLAHASLCLTLLVGITGCSPFTSRPLFGPGDTQGYWLPLTVFMQLDESVMRASLAYGDACQQPQSLPIGDGLQAALRREIGTVFEHVQESPAGPAASKGAPEGTVRVALGLSEVDVIIPRRGTQAYPATVTLGATVGYYDADGTELTKKKLRAEAKGDVETHKDKCEVKGLSGLANEAMATLAQGIKKHLGTSLKIQQAARERIDARRGMGGVPAAVATPTEAMSEAAVVPPSGAGPLSFRAMLQEQSRDQVVRGGERLTVEVEVKNEGATDVDQVAVTFSGTRELVAALAEPIRIGTLRAGETRRMSGSGILPNVSGVQQGELILAVTTTPPLAAPPLPKRFVVALQPTELPTAEALSVDVDQIPQPVRGYAQRKAVGVAVGIGAFRDASVEGPRYAAHDAEVIGKYLRAVTGIPSDRIKVLTDERALKEDLVEVFEEWLPANAQPGGIVVVYFAGRVVVEPDSGAVWLLPYEGTPQTPQRSLSLRRLHAALTGLSARQVVLLLEVTAPGEASGESLDGVQPVWEPSGKGRGKMVQVVGITRPQRAVQHEQGMHGLFTYYLLKGLSGAADEDRNGTVVLGELVEYARAQVSATARTQYRIEQKPVASSALTPHAKAWNIPLGRVQ